MSFYPGVVSVRVPATSANLGPGFDTLGLALGLYDELSAQVTDLGLQIEMAGEGVADLASDESHLVIQAMRATFDQVGAQPGGLHLRCRNRIPHGRGLGSSAAAIVAGVLLARELAQAPLSTEQCLVLAAAIEGHPDNVAACLLGGLTIAWTDGDEQARACRLEPVGVRAVVLIPQRQSSTKVARQALPEFVPHRDAVFNAARSALLVGALTCGRPEELLSATADTLHQPYRAGDSPESTAVLTRLRADGIAAVISGAGPTVLALCRSVAEVDSVRAYALDGWRIEELGVDFHGATILDRARAGT